MKKRGKRLLAALMAAALTLGLIPAGAVELPEPADEAPVLPVEEIIPVEEDLAPIEADPAEEEFVEFPEMDALGEEYPMSGTTGAEGQISWVIDPGTLTFTLTGTGAMTDYASQNDAPWFDYFYANSYRGSKLYFSIIIGEGITEIYDMPYIRVSDLSLPSTLTTIGNSCFSNQKESSDRDRNITLELPESLTYLGSYAFSDWHSLKKLVIKNPDIVLQDGEYQGCQFSGCSYLTEVVLPEGLTALPRAIFNLCTRLETINIPSTVTYIGESAFHSCTYLTEIDLPAGLTEIQYRTFKNCYRLTGVVLPPNLELIGSQAFINCNDLASIGAFPDTLKEIQTEAFQNCSALSMDGFYFTTAMRDGGSIGEHAFLNCQGITGHITIPPGVNLGDGCFASCDGITSITLPDDPTQVDGSSVQVNSVVAPFSDCSGLTSVTIPEGWTYIRDYMFRGCDNLTEVIIPEGVTDIQERAFSYSGLETVELPSSLKKIGESAFSHSSLREVVLPEGMTELGIYAFDDCNQLVEVTLPSTLTCLTGTYGGREAFRACDALTTVHFPENTTRIPERIFSGCKALKSVDLPAGLEYIGYEAFENCTALSKVTIPKKVKQIGEAAFYNTGLTYLRFTGDAPVYESYTTRPDPIVSEGVVIYYSPSAKGWTSPEWKPESTSSNYSAPVHTAYPVLASDNVDFHDGDYLAQISLYHFSFQNADGPLDQVTLTYGDESILSEGKSELEFGMVLDPSASLTFTREGYYPVTLPAAVVNNFTTVTFVPTTRTQPFIQSFYARHGEKGSYSDLLHGSFAFAGGSLDEMTQFYLNINWVGGASGTPYLSPDLTADNGWLVAQEFGNAVNISAKLSPGDGLNLLLVQDERIIDAVALDVIVTEADQELDFELDDGSSPAPIQATSGTDLSFLLSKYQFDLSMFKALPFTIDVEPDGTFRVMLGIKFDEALDDHEFGSYYGSIKDRLVYESGDRDNKFKSMDTIQNLLTNRGGGVTVGQASVGIEGDFQVFGYGEGKLEYDPATGRPTPVFVEAAVGFSLEGKLVEKVQLYINGFPVYISGEIANKFTTTIPLGHNPDQTTALVPPYHLAKLENELSIRLEAGLGWDKLLAAGVYGKGSGTLGGYIPLSLDETYLKFKASFGLSVEVFSVFEQDFTIFESDNFYAWGEENDTRARSVAAYAARHLADADFKPVSRDYLTAPTDRPALLAVGEENTAVTKNTLAQNILPTANVQVATFSTGRQVAVWTHDPGTAVRAAANNRTVLYFATRDSAQDAWSVPSPVLAEDDGTADFNPLLKVENDTAGLVWQNASRPLTAGDDQTTIPAILDLSVATMDVSDDGFSLQKTIGTEYFDTAYDFYISSGGPMVVWASNSANSLFEGAGTYSIHQQHVYWSEADTLVTGLNQVDGICNRWDGFWYSTDTDAHSGELSDYAVYHFNGSESVLVADNGATKPTLVNDTLTWYQNGIIRCGEEEITLAADTDRYQYLVSPTGMRAVVYSRDNEERQSTLYATFDDGTGWGTPVVLSDLSGNISGLSAFFDQEGSLNVLACERALDPDKSNYLSGIADLNLYTVTPFCDLVATNADYLAQSMVKDGQLDLMVDVENVGMAAAQTVTVKALNGEEELNSATYLAALTTGDSGQFYISVPLTDPAALTDLSVVVTADGYAEATPHNNTAPITLRTQDLSAEGSQITVNGDTATLRTMVVNRGLGELTGITAALVKEDGTEVERRDISDLAPGAGEFAAFEVAVADMDQLLTVRVAAANVELDNENLRANNAVNFLVDGKGKAQSSLKITAGASKDTDGTVDVALLQSGASTGVAHVLAAGYDDDGRMVDMTMAQGDFHTASLSGAGITLVKVFGLNADLVPITPVQEFSVD